MRPAIAIGALLAVGAAVVAWQLNGSPSSAPNTPTTTQQTTTGSTTTTKKKHHPLSPPPGALPSRAILVASRGACWLEVRQGDATGALLYENTLQQGQTLPVKLTNGPVWIRIGLPANLDIRLGGKLAHGLPTQPINVLLNRRGWKLA